MNNGYTPYEKRKRALSALSAIPNDLHRPEWHRAGIAAIAAGLLIDDIVAWSEPGYDKFNEHDVRDAFKTITPGGGITERTLFQIAFENGWTDDSKTHAPEKKPTKPQQSHVEPRKPLPGMNAAEVWARCLPVPLSHEYAVRKQLSDRVLTLLRVVPTNDKLYIAGTPCVGYLVVPCYAPDGQLQTLQFIPPEHGVRKLNLPYPIKGTTLTVGSATDTTVFVESMANADSVWQSTGYESICCFGSGNIKGAIADYRSREPDKSIVILPDRGKENEAVEIAREYKCSVALLPEGEPDKFDCNDLFVRDGVDVLQALFDKLREPPLPEPLLKPVSIFDLYTNPSPPPAFIWDGYLPRGTVTLFGAHGGTGKSTVGLMLSVCVAMGMPLFDVATTQCKVLFVSLEDGTHIIRHRLSFICRAMNINPELLRDSLHILDGTAHPELFSSENRNGGDKTGSYHELSRKVKTEGYGLVIVDNASDAFGGDEIVRRQVRAFMRTMAEIARLGDCATLLLAHVDKGTSRGNGGSEAYSGSTAWHNSARSRLFMSRDSGGLLKLEHQKSNLGRMREPITLEWPDNGLPSLVGNYDNPGSGQQQGRADDKKAIALLRMIHEFESLGQFCSPALKARNNVHAMLRNEPGFKVLKLDMGETARIVTQCQRAKWIEPFSYRSVDRKPRERWTLTAEGRAIAGLPPMPESEGAPSAPSAPSAPTCHESADGAQDANA
jgi:putative DNA primase/helicase